MPLGQDLQVELCWCQEPHFSCIGSIDKVTHSLTNDPIIDGLIYSLIDDLIDDLNDDLIDDLINDLSGEVITSSNSFLIEVCNDL